MLSFLTLLATLLLQLPVSCLNFYLTHEFNPGKTHCRPENERFDKGIRCCIDTPTGINCTSNNKKGGCFVEPAQLDTGVLYTNYSYSKYLCESNGYRLCNFTEYKSFCLGKGCWGNPRQVWTSTQCQAYYTTVTTFNYDEICKSGISGVSAVRCCKFDMGQCYAYVLNTDNVCYNTFYNNVTVNNISIFDAVTMCENDNRTLCSVNVTKENDSGIFCHNKGCKINDKYQWTNEMCNYSVITTPTPTISPSQNPSLNPTIVPTVYPSNTPTNYPSNEPSLYPSKIPSVIPTEIPSVIPSNEPSKHPSQLPSVIPTKIPSETPSNEPSMYPSIIPSVSPSEIPSVYPSELPSNFPSNVPSIYPSNPPSKNPSNTPFYQPTNNPSKTTANIVSGETHQTNVLKFNNLMLFVIITIISLLIIVIIMFLCCFTSRLNHIKSKITLSLKRNRFTIDEKKMENNIQLANNNEIGEINIEEISEIEENNYKMSEGDTITLDFGSETPIGDENETIKIPEISEVMSETMSYKKNSSINEFENELFNQKIVNDLLMDDIVDNVNTDKGNKN